MCVSARARGIRGRHPFLLLSDCAHLLYHLFSQCRDDAGDMWLGALRQKLACTRPAMCLPPSNAAVSSKFFAAASSQYGREQAWVWVCRRHKEMKCVKGGEKAREVDWGTYASAGENCGKRGRTDRWAEWGRRKEEWIVEREGQKSWAGGDKEMDWLGDSERKAVEEGKTGRFGRCVVWR